MADDTPTEVKTETADTTSQEQSNMNQTTSERKGIISDASTLPKSNDHDEIRKQVEFYFTDANLRFDKFLYSLVTAENKWVDLDVVAAFNRMRRFDYDEVKKAMETSELMEMNEEKDKIRRKVALKAQRDGSKIVDHTIDRSLYAKGFGVETPTSQFDIEKLFESTSLKINAVRLRRDEDKIFKGSVFVEFKDTETLKKFLDLENKPTWNDQQMQLLKASNEESESNDKKEEGSGEETKKEDDEDISTTDKATKEAANGIKYMTKRDFVDMKMADIRSGKIQPTTFKHNRPQKFDAFREGQNQQSSHHHRGGNRRGGNNRGHNNNSSDSRRSRDDRDNNNDGDWRARREEDRKNGFRNDRRGGGGNRGRGGRGGGGGDRNRDGPRDRDGNGIPKIKSSAPATTSGSTTEATERTNENTATGGDAMDTSGSSPKNGVEKRAREEDEGADRGEEKKVKVDA